MQHRPTGIRLEATREIRRRLPDTKVLALTMHEDEEYLRRMLAAGATGYVLKRAVGLELAGAIRAVYRGQVFIYPTLMGVVLKDMLPAGDQSDSERTADLDPLSQRERQVLRLVAQGYSSRQIAKELFLSVRTIENYRANLMVKLDLKSRVALVRYALRTGLLDDVIGDPPGQ